MNRPAHIQAGPKGFSLIEMVVTSAIVLIIMLGSLSVFTEGVQLFKTNTAASEGQAAAIKVIGKVTAEASNASRELTRLYAVAQPFPPGIVFASPLALDGSSQFHPITGDLYWQRLISFYFIPAASGDNGIVYRAEESLNGGAGETDRSIVQGELDTKDTVFFSTTGGLQTTQVSDGITGFEIKRFDGDLSDSGAAAPAATGTTFDIIVQAGRRSQAGSKDYFITVKSRVTPRG